MRSKKQKLTKKTTFSPRWKTKGVGDALIFAKLALIFLFCTIGFSVSAQQTNLQSRLETKNKNDTINIDGQRWCVIKTQTVSGIKYSFLLSCSTSLEGSTNFGSNNIYQGSTIQSRLNSFYTNNFYLSQLRPIAVVPTLGDLSSQTTSNVSEPTSELASGSGKTNILFAPSYKDMTDWCGIGGTVLSIPNWQQWFNYRFWTRTPFNFIGSGAVYEVFPQANSVLVETTLMTTYVTIAGAIWVRTTAIAPTSFNVSGTVTVNGGTQSNVGIKIYYRINNDNLGRYVETGAGGTYSIPNVLSGSNIKIEPETISHYLLNPQTREINSISTNYLNENFTYSLDTHYIQGKIYGVPSSFNYLTISYRIDDQVTLSTMVTDHGTYKEYKIENITHGSKVEIYPLFLNNYYDWYFLEPSPSTNPVTSDILNKDIRYYRRGFNINGVDFILANGKSYCDHTFTITANDTGSELQNIKWFLDNVELTGYVNQKIISGLYIPTGIHTILMQAIYYPSHIVEFQSTIGVGEFPIIWQGADNDWYNKYNWFPNIVPSACNDVYILGDHDPYRFPQLTATYGVEECRDIYFMYGAQLGRPDLLKYRHAHVQYNFGLTKGVQRFVGNERKSILNNSSTSFRMEYGANFSTSIPREQWRMLSVPLKSVFTGDFGFGGFPLTFLRKYDAKPKQGQSYFVGGWTTTYKGMNFLAAEQVTDGFAFYMYGYALGGDITRNMGCEEIGTFGSSLLESGYFSFRNGNTYGIDVVNGILELPSFTDSLNLFSHRTQTYNPVSNVSYFYHINDGTYNPANLNKITDTYPQSVPREDYEGYYRFAPESYNGSSWAFQNTLYHKEDADIGDEFLVGNPYMSPIRMYDFLKTNGFNNANLAQSYRIWNGTDFVTGTTSTSGINSIYSSNPSYDLNFVNPQQGFFLKKAGNSNLGVAEFKVEDIAYVRFYPMQTAPAENPNYTTEENFLRIKAENDFADSYSVIAYREGASNSFNPNEDVDKLFTPLDYVPSIYSLSDKTPVDFNFINNKGIIIVPLGIKTEQTGDMSLTFTGMDNYLQASKIEFIDALENQTVDITGKSSYTYSFNHTVTGIQNGRFSLRISSSTTSIPDVDISDDLRVYGNSKEIFVISSEAVEKLEIYDLTGIKLYENDSDARYYPLQGNLSHSPLVVKVVTKSRVKTVKVN